MSYQPRPRTLAVVILGTVLSWAFAYQVSAGTFSTIKNETFSSRYSKGSVGTPYSNVAEGLDEPEPIKDYSPSTVSPDELTERNLWDTAAPTPIADVTEGRTIPLEGYEPAQPVGLDDFMRRNLRSTSSPVSGPASSGFQGRD